MLLGHQACNSITIKKYRQWCIGKIAFWTGQKIYTAERTADREQQTDCQPFRLSSCLSRSGLSPRNRREPPHGCYICSRGLCLSVACRRKLFDRWNRIQRRIFIQKSFLHRLSRKNRNDAGCIPQIRPQCRRRKHFNVYRCQTQRPRRIKISYGPDRPCLKLQKRRNIYFFKSPLHYWKSLCFMIGGQFCQWWLSLWWQVYVYIQLKKTAQKQSISLSLKNRAWVRMLMHSLHKKSSGVGRCPAIFMFYEDLIQRLNLPKSVAVGLMN